MQDTPLAAFSAMGQLQTGTHGISSTARYGARVPESTRSGIRSTKSIYLQSSSTVNAYLVISIIIIIIILFV